MAKSKKKTVSKRKTVPKGKTMFYEPAHYATLADMVKITSVPEAKVGARQLKQEFREAKTRAKRVRVKRAAVLAANRADASSRKRNLKRGTKTRLRKVSSIYRKAADGMIID